MMKNAKWIWYGDPGYDLVNSWMQARRTFNLKSVPAKAVINVTADTRYRLYVNGKHVNRGPARGFQETWSYDTLNITLFLKKGKNVIAVIVHNYGIGTFQYVHQGYAGFLLWGEIGSEDVSSNKKWRVRPAPGFKRVTTRVSLQLGFQEFFDAKRDDDSWLFPSYDDFKWISPESVRNFGSMPWHSLEERGIPLLREEIMVPQTLISKATERCSKDFLESVDVVTLFLSEHMRWNDATETLERTKTWANFQVQPTGRNNYTAYCIDFGKEVVGSLRLAVEGADGGEIIDTIVCEGIEGKEPVIESPLVGCRVSFGNRLFLRSGKTEHEQFDHWGFRYLVLIVRNSTKKLNIKLKLHWLGYPLNLKADFQSSNKMLNRIYEISKWTQQCCMLDSYIDCPWREQAQWWGDARVQAKNTFYLSADARLLKRGIRQIGTQEVKNGLSYGHAPTISHNCILPDFTLTWIITHRDYYWQTGDLSFFKGMRDRIHRAFDYFHKITAKNGLLPYDDKYWLFLDWCDIFKDGYSTLYNLLYLMALRTAIELFKLSGDIKSARMYSGRERALLSAIKKKLFNYKTGLFYGGLSWNNKPVAENTAHVFSFAILLNLFPEYHQTFIDKYLLPLVKGNRKEPIMPSPFFMFYIFEAIKKYGYTEEVVDCINRWWGEMVKKDLTTTEETWDVQPGSGSLCHAWSAHPIVHLSNILLGVWQENPGWKEIRFSPTFSHADYVKGKVATPYGTIESGWKKNNTEIDVYLKLPPGITGKIVLPGKKTERIRGRGNWTIINRDTSHLMGR